jgi:hypothetical protein
MNVEQQIMAIVQTLPLERQREVLAFTETLASKVECTPRVSSYGSCADIRTDLSFEEFAQNRREMWGNATDTEMDR